MAEWLMDRLAALYGAEYDLIATAAGLAAVPHETGRETLRAHSPLVLAVLLGQAAAGKAHGEPALERCHRAHGRVQGAHAAREARRG
jgi:hypothetical protein